MMVKRFYERNQEPVGFDQDEADWTIKTDRFGRPLFGVESNDKDIPLSYYKSNSPDAILQFYSFDTLQNKYGVKFMRDELGVTNYQPPTARLKAGRAELKALITAKNEVNAAKEEIPMQEFSTQTDVQKTVDATNQIETSLQTLMELPDVKNAQTQTEGLTLRELQGLDKALQRTRGELTNNLSKLTELDKDITRQKQKLQEAEDEASKRDIRSRIKKLRR